MITPANPEEAVYTLNIPAHAETQEQATAMIAELPEDLSNSHVIIDTSENPWAKPAFVYEARTQILDVRSAKSLTIKNEGSKDLNITTPNLNNFIQSDSYLQFGQGSLRYTRH